MRCKYASGSSAASAGTSLPGARHVGQVDRGVPEALARRSAFSYSRSVSHFSLSVVPRCWTFSMFLLEDDFECFVYAPLCDVKDVAIFHEQRGNGNEFKRLKGRLKIAIKRPDLFLLAALERWEVESVIGTEGVHVETGENLDDSLDAPVLHDVLVIGNDGGSILKGHGRVGAGFKHAAHGDD